MKAKLSLLQTLLGIGMLSTSAYASDGVAQSGAGPLVWAFMGFGALILVMQTIPAFFMLYSMVKGLFMATKHTPDTSH